MKRLRIRWWCPATILAMGYFATAAMCAGQADKRAPMLLMHTPADPTVPVEHSAQVATADPAIERHVIAADGIHIHAHPERAAEKNRDRRRLPARVRR